MYFYITGYRKKKVLLHYHLCEEKKYFYITNCRKKKNNFTLPVTGRKKVILYYQLQEGSCN